MNAKAPTAATPPLGEPASSPLSRRVFVRGAALAAGATAVSTTLPSLPFAGGRPQLPSQLASRRPATPRSPVVGFHMDRPFLDPTGMAEPYVPPVGTRSGQVLAELTEHEYLSRHPYG
jgi:hypothetical protein